MHVRPSAWEQVEENLQMKWDVLPCSNKRFWLDWQAGKKKMPRVRIELTTFRLWDWRAAYCANEATTKISSCTRRLAPVAQSVSASYLYVSNDKEMRRSGVRASPGASIIYQLWRKDDIKKIAGSLKLVAKEWPVWGSNPRHSRY